MAGDFLRSRHHGEVIGLRAVGRPARSLGPLRGALVGRAQAQVRAGYSGPRLGPGGRAPRSRLVAPPGVPRRTPPVPRRPGAVCQARRAGTICPTGAAARPARGPSTARRRPAAPPRRSSRWGGVGQGRVDEDRAADRLAKGLGDCRQEAPGAAVCHEGDRAGGLGRAHGPRDPFGEPAVVAGSDLLEGPGQRRDHDAMTPALELRRAAAPRHGASDGAVDQHQHLPTSLNPNAGARTLTATA